MNKARPLQPRGFVAGPDRGRYSIYPVPLPGGIRDCGHNLELDQSGDRRSAGILPFQVFGICSNAVPGNAVARGDVGVQQTATVKPSQPSAVALLDFSVLVGGTSCPAAPCFQQIAGL